jgi:hypothetical protein
LQKKKIKKIGFWGSSVLNEGWETPVIGDGAADPQPGPHVTGEKFSGALTGEMRPSAGFQEYLRFSD